MPRALIAIIALAICVAAIVPVAKAEIPRSPKLITSFIESNNIDVGGTGNFSVRKAARQFADNHRKWRFRKWKKKRRKAWRSRKRSQSTPDTSNQSTTETNNRPTTETSNQTETGTNTRVPLSIQGVENPN